MTGYYLLLYHSPQECVGHTPQHCEQGNIALPAVFPCSALRESAKLASIHADCTAHVPKADTP